MNWKWIHRWFANNLEGPFFQAEMHRVKMQLPDSGVSKEVKLHLVEGRKPDKHCTTNSEIKRMRKVL